MAKYLFDYFLRLRKREGFLERNPQSGASTTAQHTTILGNRQCGGGDRGEREKRREKREKEREEKKREGKRERESGNTDQTLPACKNRNTVTLT